MECYVCSADAEKLPTLGDWVELNCGAGCGHYRISGTLTGELAATGRKLNTEQTRLWIATHRITNPAPLITSSTAHYA